MKRIKLVVAYEWTNYHGCQMQPNGLSVEAVLNEALSALLKEPITVIGASRTDSGVHALGNVAVFDTENRMPGDKICFALNQRLPEDIRIQSSEEVAADWHPRKQNCAKTYEYRILNRKIDMPVGRQYAYFCYFPIDVERMRQGAEYLVGEHDFKSFCTVRTQAEDTVRVIYSLSVERGADDVVSIRICGSGFLYNMVRIIAGTLLRVGTGLYSPQKVEEILDARDRQAAGPTLPAKGLTLISLEYEKRLQPEIKAANKDWEYLLVQREIPAKKKAYLLIYRCKEEDFRKLSERLLRQAARNGAKWIYMADIEGWDRERQALAGIGGKDQAGREACRGEEISGSGQLRYGGRIRDGERFGCYEMRRSHAYLEMEKTLGEPILRGNEAEGKGAESREAEKEEAERRGAEKEEAERRGAEKEEAERRGAEREGAKGKRAEGEGWAGRNPDREKQGRVKLCPLEKADWEKWLSWYNESFFDLPGSATYDRKTIAGQEEEGSGFFWICADERPVGTLVLGLETDGEKNGESTEKAVMIDVIAIKKEFTGRGYGQEALLCIEEYARERGILKLTLLVADTNSRARRLYEKAGFRTARRRPEFFCAGTE